MAIKDKDGKVYKLRGPNPLNKNQEDWNRSKMNLINLNWESEVVEDERNPVVAFEENLVKIDEELGLVPNTEANQTEVIEPKEFIKEIQETKPEPPKPEPEPEPPKPEPKPTIEAAPQLARLLQEKGVEYYCAPAIGKKTHMDDLYGNVYQTVQYGDKFIFDAIVVGESDLELQFWCVRPVNIESIVYRKIREGGERWWRIKDVEPKTGGYLALAVVSDTNPDFS